MEMLVTLLSSPVATENQVEVKPNVTIGDLVLVKEDNLPPLVWKKAVIIDMHTGQDGLVRVLTIRTAAGTFIRLIANICVHPKVD